MPLQIKLYTENLYENTSGRIKPVDLGDSIVSPDRSGPVEAVNILLFCFFMNSTIGMKVVGLVVGSRWHRLGIRMVAAFPDSTRDAEAAGSNPVASTRREFRSKERGIEHMEYIRVTKENLEKEHICCAISNNKDVQVSSKKAWLTERFDEGLVFMKFLKLVNG